MSGGVDSSVAAAILIEQGYDVTGIIMQVWTEHDKHSLSEEEHPFDYDARRVADKLGISLYVIDVRDVFKDKVVAYFINEYISGRTPNPCVQCNKNIKFGILLDKANELGMDYMATGHYALVEYDKNINRFLLKKAAYAEKDQSYVLYNLTQNQLYKVLFPIGNYTKQGIREKAKYFGLPVADKHDSQEICFIRDNNYIRFLEDNFPTISKPGLFIDKNGNVLGTHKGIIHYTIGQRRGLDIAFGKKMFVSGINVEENTVIIGEENEVFSDKLFASETNFIPFDNLDGEFRVKAKIRYSAEESAATIKPTGNRTVMVYFDTSQRAITPGQAVVFYDGDIVIGGGTIQIP